MDAGPARYRVEHLGQLGWDKRRRVVGVCSTTIRVAGGDN
jgi:hypothetical protein